MYGEYVDSSLFAQPLYGSSPRVRGIPKVTRSPTAGARFIPACTGNTQSSWPQTNHSSVHPRVYGEYAFGALGHGDTSGSSPRVRGILFPMLFNQFDARFIPACTGNTIPSTKARRHPAVHPRVYGEYIIAGIPSGNEHGSSPRVRGILDSGVCVAPYPRFIPACTGNTSTRNTEGRCRTVHPRVYGEYDPTEEPDVSFSGSSPRVRGIRYMQAPDRE